MLHPSSNSSGVRRPAGQSSSSGPTPSLGRIHAPVGETHDRGQVAVVLGLDGHYMKDGSDEVLEGRAVEGVVVSQVGEEYVDLAVGDLAVPAESIERGEEQPLAPCEGRLVGAEALSVRPPGSLDPGPVV